MIIREIEVKKNEGMSRSDAQAIVQRAMRYSSSIMFEYKTSKVNAKSLMGVLSMTLIHGDKLMIIVNGDDQDEAFAEMSALFSNSFRVGAL